jgi:hypothetical protein
MGFAGNAVSSDATRGESAPAKKGRPCSIRRREKILSRSFENLGSFGILKTIPRRKNSTLASWHEVLPPLRSGAQHPYAHPLVTESSRLRRWPEAYCFPPASQKTRREEKGNTMRPSSRTGKISTTGLAFILSIGLWAHSSLAQDQPPAYSPDQLDKLVSRIALYPDPLLAQILTASTFPDQIPDAAKWADEHHYLTGEELAKSIQDDQLSWDPSVQALLPFPSVLDTMASDMNWTTDLGDAVLAQRPDVMDAVQRMRQKAKDFGYLRSNGQIVVSGGSYIEIAPVDPAFVVVPFYDPLIVFAAPRPGFVLTAGIGFGFGVTIGTWFRPCGWGSSRFVWASHALIVNNVRWQRTWVNRATYVHPYPGLHRYAPANRVEHHELVQRSDAERQAAHTGHPVHEEHEHHH